MDIRQKLFDELASFSEKSFGQRDHFVCVYGSYASGHHTETSDMDVFIALEDNNAADLEKAKDFLIDLHERYGLCLDDEVPYENKLVVSYEDVRRAVELRPFLKDGTRYVVPAVKKEKDFLASPEVRWRLILNALTSPHERVYGNEEVYEVFKTEAEGSVVRLARGLTRSENPTRRELLEALLSGDHEEEGEMYLGYKRERDAVVRHLDGEWGQSRLSCEMYGVIHLCHA